jgi:carbonic anhydrase/acetyltransferase-like protein (isoleucine patch superfamily)
MIIKYKDKDPQIAESAWLAPNTTVIGDVTIEEGASIWFGAVLRGDNQPIHIGRGSNIQDNSTLHCNRYSGMTVGENVTVGHNVVLHSCTIGDNCLIGMGAVVMDNAVIGENSIVGAGALVTPGKIFPPNSLIVGAPARVKSEVTEEALKSAISAGEEYRKRAEEYKNSQQIG